MSNRERYPNPQPKPITGRMRAILANAANRRDGAVTSVDYRTIGPLYRRGYVEYLRGRSTDRYGETAYNVVVGIYITDAGREAIRN
jgi:hypothetical protein